MKSLNMTLQSDENLQPEEQSVKLNVIPAKLHDDSGEVYDDQLYTMYTTSTNIVGTEINTSIIASDLVKHTLTNMNKGYWVGIGINADVFRDEALIYVGWGEPIDSELVDFAQPYGEQTVGEEVYKTFYFDAEKASLYKNKAYVVVDRNGIHYHYSIDFSQITRKESQEELEPISWSQISVKDVKDNYLFGIDLSDANGNPLPEGLFVHYINSAVEWLQSTLDILIKDTEVKGERHDYIRNDYQNWGYMQCLHTPVKEVKAVRMMYGDRPSVEIPIDWVQLNKLTGQITLFPAAGSANSLIIGQTGMLFGFQSQWSYSPLMWEIDYVSGVDEKDPSVPFELMKEAVAKRACCGILNVWGKVIHRYCYKLA